MAPVPEHSHLRALGRDLERTARQVGDLDAVVRSLAADVDTLTRRLGPGSPEAGDNISPTPDSGDRPGAGRRADVSAWLLAEHQEYAEADLDDLIAWLDRVYLVYRDAVLPSCWLWHPDAVEELWCLRRAHGEAYHPVIGSWVRAGDWHDRLRPNVVERLKPLRVCELSEHRPGRPASHPAPQAPLADAARDIAAWAAAGRPGSAPEPTGEQLAQAEVLMRRDLERRRR